MGESAASSGDKYECQEGETKSLEGDDCFSTKSGASSPLNSNDGSPSKNSTKRRRPFECPESLTCQLCNIDFPTAHELTLHVRTHNTASSHSCKICGKKLSSTSSLDRHMLIHSGERPFTCPLCAMSFTTNGNMHRHLRTHEKGGELPPPDYVVKHDYAKPRKRIPSRRVLENMDVDYTPQSENQSPKKKLNGGERKSSEKKVVTDKMAPIEKNNVGILDTEGYISDEPINLSTAEVKTQKEILEDGEKREEELLCPICNKTFLCRYGLQTHIEQHPNKVLKCMICSASFRNQKGLRMHVHMAHRKTKPNALSKQTNGTSVTETDSRSMTELGFAEFSSPKFPLIAQIWCEKNSPHTTNLNSTCAYKACNKSFPCPSALKLHQEKSHSKFVDQEEDLGKVDDMSEETNHKIPSRDEFLAALELKPRSPQSPEKQNEVDVLETKHKAPILNSMLTKSAVVTHTKARAPLVHHSQASPLLGMKRLSKSMTAQESQRETEVTPMKHSPAKGMTAGSVLQSLKSERDISETANCGVENELEPRSGDVAMEMHTPCEFASQSNTIIEDSDDPEQSVEVTQMEREGAFAESLEEIEEEPCDLSSPSKKRGSHMCKYCKKVFPFASTLKVHTRSHMGLMPYKCMLCDYASADKSTLVRHMRTHSGERPFVCKVCDFAFTTKANCERHVRKRHDKKTKEEAEEVIMHNPVPKHENENKYSSPCTVCKICNRDFKFFRDLQNHLRVHEKTPQKPFTCIKCQVGFSSLSNCARHILRRHVEVKSDEVESYITVYQHEDDKNAPIVNDVKKEPRNEDPVLNENGEQIEPLDFSLRKSPEERNSDVKTVQRRTSIYTEDAPIDLSMPKSALPQNLSVRTTNSFGKYRYKEVYRKFYSETIDALVCPHCTTTFDRGSQLKTHIRSHTSERPFRCHTCAAAFTMRANLEAHIVRRHSQGEQAKSQQSFIPKSATPMQFKLMAKSASGLRFTSRAPKTAIPMVSPNTPVGAALQSKAGPSPHSSVGSDSSGELASVSKMLAATDSNHFKLYLSPPESRSPITVPEVFQQSDDDSKDDENQEILANIGGGPPEMRIDDDFSEDPDAALQLTTTADSTTDLSASIKVEESSTEQYVSDSEPIGELQIVEDEITQEPSEKDTKVDGEGKKEKRGTKFESKQCCPYCGRRFPWISSLRRHILTHTGLKPYQCPQCGANFSTKSNCERHIVRRHGGARPGSLGGSVPGGQDQPFMCPECKEFKCTTRTQLQVHYEQTHPHINFADIYPEAKKVASTSVDIMNKRLDSKQTDMPLCLSTKGDSLEKVKQKQTTGNGIPKDLSVSGSKSKKICKAKTGSLKVKLFMSKGKVTTVVPDVVMSCSASADYDSRGIKSDIKDEESRNEDCAELREVEHTEMADACDTALSDKEADDVENADDLEDNGNIEGDEAVEGVEVSDDNPGSEDREAEANTPSQLAMSLTSHASEALKSPTHNPRPHSKGKKNRAKFECTQCCKRFKTALTLERHEKVHEVEHPYHCTDCKATFTTKFNCQRHMMKLHSKKKENLSTCDLKEDGHGNLGEVKNGDDVRMASDGTALADHEFESMSNMSLNLGDSVSAMGDSVTGSRNGTPISCKLGHKSRKRPSGSHVLQKKKCAKLDEALISGTVIDFQGSSDKLTAVENWLNSDIALEDAQVNDYDAYDSAMPILNPESPSLSQEENGQQIQKKKPSEQQGLYMSSFLDDEDSLVAQDVADPSDVFSGGQNEEKNSDIISNLLGIQDSSVLDQMLESADSAARLLGVTDG